MPIIGLIFSTKCSIIVFTGENMIKTIGMLHDELIEYSNPGSKVSRMVEQGELFPIIRGLYETDRNASGLYMCMMICGPSYISFESALSYYSLIPEAVRQYTSATYGKRREKRYSTMFGSFLYHDVASQAYPFGIDWHQENGHGFLIASPEKALCDELYKTSPLGNRKELEAWLFEDMRIDMSEFRKLDKKKLAWLSGLYHTQNHRLLNCYITRMPL
jgi:predicted transcriptional regulator of viral defense system